MTGDRPERPVTGDHGERPVTGDHGERPVTGDHGERPVTGDDPAKVAAGYVAGFAAILLLVSPAQAAAWAWVPSGRPRSSSAWRW